MGTGKSVVAQILRSMGFPVYDADAAAKALYGSDPMLLQQVVDRFGVGVLTMDGVLDRSALAAKVFSDRDALRELNAMVHPAVARDFEAWRSALGLFDGDWVFREAAILFESGSEIGCDRVWAVHASMPVRLARVRERNGWSEREFLERIAHQWSSDRVNEKADAVITNDGRTALVPQVVNLVSELR